MATYCACGALCQKPWTRADDYMCPACRKEKSLADTIENKRLLDGDDEEPYLRDRHPAERELDFN